MNETKEASETAEQILKRGGVVEGVYGIFKKTKFELSRKEFRIDGQPPIPINDFTHVSTMDRVYNFYTDGVEPAFSLPAAPITRGVARVLEKHIKRRIEKGHDLSCKAPTGRKLHESFSSHKFICIFVFSLRWQSWDLHYSQPI